MLNSPEVEDMEAAGEDEVRVMVAADAAALEIHYEAMG